MDFGQLALELYRDVKKSSIMRGNYLRRLKNCQRHFQEFLEPYHGVPHGPILSIEAPVGDRQNSDPWAPGIMVNTATACLRA